jgi:hypothetical protein
MADEPGESGRQYRPAGLPLLSGNLAGVYRNVYNARKFLAFTDNRQDASLQAGHFNDFVLVGLVRSALYRAAREQRDRDPDEPLTDETLGPRVVAALGGDLKAFAKDEDTAEEPVPRRKITRALRDVVTYRLWADLKRGWRITMPNLEQTGRLDLLHGAASEKCAQSVPTRLRVVR